ncbi:hypothetical protein ACFXOD_37975 [Streptomyces sp. NPDC059161]
MASPDRKKPRRRWSGPEKAQVIIGVGSLIIALAAFVAQFVL